MAIINREKAEALIREQIIESIQQDAPVSYTHLTLPTKA